VLLNISPNLGETLDSAPPTGALYARLSSLKPYLEPVLKDSLTTGSLRSSGLFSLTVCFTNHAASKKFP
jgi:hypothetical protein